MRPGIIGLAIALAARVAADSLAVYTQCIDVFGSAVGCRDDGIFYSFGDTVGFNVNADAGCRGTAVPGMVDFCVDWSRSRAHFRFGDQASKRCLVITAIMDIGNWECEAGFTCRFILFEEVGCTWREIPAETQSTVSGAATPTNSNSTATATLGPYHTIPNVGDLLVAITAATTYPTGQPTGASS
jgi:hypothetical protein